MPPAEMAEALVQGHGLEVAIETTLSDVARLSVLLAWHPSDPGSGQVAGCRDYTLAVLQILLDRPD